MVKSKCLNKNHTGNASSIGLSPLACDLHIHSCLSPCADILMTPGNIIKKALQEELDIIAIADHNAAGNVEVTMKLAEDTKLSILPAMEVESSEEVHLLCYFDKLHALLEWEDIVRANLPEMMNDEETFGYQLITDENDEYIAKEDSLLATATGLTVKEIVDKVTVLDGIVVPSHLDRPYNSLLANLGFIPNDLELSLFELSKNVDPDVFLNKFPFLNDYFYIVSSDSHYLDDIKSYLEIDLYGDLPKRFKEILLEATKT
ncbi:PHP domain-containing protein [Natronospora cellulosivora (SeqCode)]